MMLSPNTYGGSLWLVGVILGYALRGIVDDARRRARRRFRALSRAVIAVHEDDTGPWQ